MNNFYHVWYAEHDKFGELILAVRAKKNQTQAFIYAPIVIAERLRHCWKPLYGTELSLGPLGLIPAHLYQEAGISTTIPAHLYAMISGSNSKLTEEMDRYLENWIIEEWNKQVK